MPTRSQILRKDKTLASLIKARQSILTEASRLSDEQHDHDWQTYNVILVKQYKNDSFQKGVASLKDSQKMLIEFLQTIPPENFNQDFGVRVRGHKVTTQGLLQTEVKDEETHYKQLSDSFKVPE